MPSNNTINKNFDEQEFKILKEIDEGKGIPMEEAVRELEAEYGLSRK